jgi:hypothetical protein
MFKKIQALELKNVRIRYISRNIGMVHLTWLYGVADQNIHPASAYIVDQWRRFFLEEIINYGVETCRYYV